jgi:hypothetical protein
VLLQLSIEMLGLFIEFRMRRAKRGRVSFCFMIKESSPPSLDYLSLTSALS